MDAYPPITKMKFLKIISSLPFLTQIEQKCDPKCPSDVAFLAIALNFHSGACTTTTYACITTTKVFPI